MREFEGAKVRDGFFGCECVIDPLKTNAMRSEWEADHEGGEEVVEILRADSKVSGACRDEE